MCQNASTARVVYRKKISCLNTEIFSLILCHSHSKSPKKISDKQIKPFWVTVVQNVYHRKHKVIFSNSQQGRYAENMESLFIKMAEMLACKLATFASREICNAETWPLPLSKIFLFSFSFEYKILKFCTSSSYMCVNLWLKFHNFLRWSPGKFFKNLMIWYGMTQNRFY